MTEFIHFIKGFYWALCFFFIRKWLNPNNHAPLIIYAADAIMGGIACTVCGFLTDWTIQALL